MEMSGRDIDGRGHTARADIIDRACLFGAETHIGIANLRILAVLFENDHAHRIDRAVIDSLELVTHIDIFGYQILVVDIFKNIQHLLLRYVLIIELVFAVFIGEFIEAVSM